MSLVGSVPVWNAEDGQPRERRPSAFQDEEPHSGIGLHRTSTSHSNKRSGSVARPSTGLADEKASEKVEEKGSDTASTDEEDMRREKEVQQLARKVTRQSSYYSENNDVNPFDAPENSKYDPKGTGFSAKAWVRRALEFHREDPKSGPGRTVGIAFKNLHVFGFGSTTDYQKSVGNIWLEMYGLVQGLFKSGQRRIDILRDFEGLVHPGELLVVLGPPGSGCSTFLKTISGEMSGLNIQEGSYINYQGGWRFPILLLRYEANHDYAQVSPPSSCRMTSAAKLSILQRSTSTFLKSQSTTP